jgi:hypothetical protein
MFYMCAHVLGVYNCIDSFIFVDSNNINDNDIHPLFTSFLPLFSLSSNYQLLYSLTHSIHITFFIF